MIVPGGAVFSATKVRKWYCFHTVAAEHASRYLLANVLFHISILLPFFDPVWSNSGSAYNNNYYFHVVSRDKNLFR